MKVWGEAEIQRYIDDEVEESHTLDYKAAEALGRSDGKKHEITKDVSAMANADGGIIIYGLKEHPARRHVVESLNPVDRTQFSKEWLDQIISTIRPYIDTVIVHPVGLSSGPNDVAYVLEIPKGNTAHQSTNLRYYRRRNFESVAMHDDEIRDVMNRATVPDASVSFDFRLQTRVSDRSIYLLLPFIKNAGDFLIKDFKLTMKFPRVAAQGSNILHRAPNFNISFDKDHDFFIDYQSTRLFPDENRNIGEDLLWTYDIDSAVLTKLISQEFLGRDIVLSWTLYADNMTPKRGTYPIQKLHDR
jgi:hypothetical protein